MEDEEEAAAYVPKISPEQARELGSIRLTCFRAYVQEQDLRQPLRHLEHNPPVRKPVVSEVLKKDLVIHREGDKFLSNTVKYAELVYDHWLRAEHNAGSDVVKLLT